MKKTLYILLFTTFVYAQPINKMQFDRFTHYSPDDWITYAYSNHITSIDIGIHYIFFGTSDGGILRYHFFENEWHYPLTTSTGLSSNKIQKIVFNKAENGLYAFTDKGIDFYNEAFGYWQSSSSPPPQEEQIIRTSFEPFSRPPIKNWPTFFPERNFTIMPDGILYDADNDAYKILDRIVDEWQRLWFGTNGMGIGIADLNTYSVEFKKQSIPKISPRDIYVKNDDIWIGGFPLDFQNRGIVYWDYQKDQWYYYSARIESNIFSDVINVIEGMGSFVFFGTDQGLLKFNKKTQQWTNMRDRSPLKSDNILDLCVLNDNLYIASINGVFSYNPYTNDLEQIANRYINQTQVNTITASDSLLFIGTNFGIFGYNSENQQTVLFKSRAAIPDNFIDALTFNKGKLWFAGRNGIGYNNIYNDTWKSFPGLNFSLKDKINYALSTNNSVWFATDGGLLKYDIIRDSWYLYTTKDGLAGNKISRIESDGDYLWLTTNNGITLFLWNEEGRFE